jgi:hypothetical protein
MLLNHIAMLEDVRDLKLVPYSRLPFALTHSAFKLGKAA